ncbi:preprotein translocase subunit YajC [Facklamia sp. 7083-14-GEN3]|uniref:preprotein translocase subunit YajC n=1 Tax=Facklamia sp. 7083-14-GEN3 TaxID=2973478 RepID=UPI00215D171E|nr:preprotein translocase subunit YajC [Facklamia sp. 7083-14-GEN3]MCR8968722.1 preprotein translocase subunit YajC [Facklamia sp. 7083-14-GEN3]
MGNSYFAFLPMIIMFALFYFMLIRPQKKAADQKRQMIEAMQAGDGVVTIGGLHGIVDEVKQQEGLVVLDCEGIYLTFELSAVANVLKSAGSNEQTVYTSDNETHVESDLETDANV